MNVSGSAEIAWRPPVGRDAVLVEGPDAAAFLEGQCSQAVADLPVGEGRETCVLEPKGNLGYWARVVRLEPEAFLLHVDAGQGEGLRERLARFRIRVDVTIGPSDLEVVEVRGTDVVPVEGLRIPFSWGELAGYDLIADAPAVAGSPESAIGACSADAWLATRIRVGMPEMGTDSDERSLPIELGLTARTVSFTKGCYTGQELTARMESRGAHAVRRLVGLSGSGAAPVPGAAIHVDGRAVGSASSVCAEGDGWIALGMLHRSVAAPGTVEVDGVSAPAEVRQLPGSG